MKILLAAGLAALLLSDLLRAESSLLAVFVLWPLNGFQ